MKFNLLSSNVNLLVINSNMSYIYLLSTDDFKLKITPSLDYVEKKKKKIER